MKRNHQQSLLGILVFLLAVSVLSPRSSETASTAGRKYYLTKDTFPGSDALTACASGYHMASLWEIFDPSNLKYNTILGLKNDDSGSGPPSDRNGWVRTGASSNVSNTPGHGNCAVWSSGSNSDFGTAAELEDNFVIQSDDRVNPWTSSAISCDATFVRVWCVQN